MSPDQRARALRLADDLDEHCGVDTPKYAADLLRELAAEPEQQPARVPMTEDEIDDATERVIKANPFQSLQQILRVTIKATEAHHGITATVEEAREAAALLRELIPADDDDFVRHIFGAGYEIDGEE